MESRNWFFRSKLLVAFTRSHGGRGCATLSLFMSRILITTFGSLGDLNPYCALAAGLRARGHDPIIATSAGYRAKVEALGVGFHPVRPDITEVATPEMMRRVMHHRMGPEVVVRELFMSRLRETLEDTLPAMEGVDLMIAHSLSYSARLAAELRGVRWISTILQPLAFLSASEVPTMMPGPLFPLVRALGPAFGRGIISLVRWHVRNWGRPWHELRTELGLRPAGDPVIDGQHSPELVLALFSEVFGPRQADWPTQTKLAGFLFTDDEDAKGGLPGELSRFLEEGPAPLVFTLGSAAVMDAGLFFEYSVDAAERLGKRAVLMVGPEPRNHPSRLPKGMIAVPSAPFSLLFPRAAAIVHQGGVGTTAQAMRAGRPMLVMPYAHDQPDNAARVVRLGIARTISRFRYNAHSATRELTRLLEDPAYGINAVRVGELIRRENGVASACDAVEAVLAATDPVG